MNYPNYPYPNVNPYAVRTSTNSINWVQGIEGAKAFTLMPKENVILMDSEVNDKFYIKICDDGVLFNISYPPATLNPR